MQEILRPDVFWYNAGLPENLPGINFGGPDGKVCKHSSLPSSTRGQVKRRLFMVFA